MTRAILPALLLAACSAGGPGPDLFPRTDALDPCYVSPNYLDDGSGLPCDDVPQREPPPADAGPPPGMLGEEPPPLGLNQAPEPPPPPPTRYDPEGLMGEALERWNAVIGVELDDLPSFAIYTADSVTCNGSSKNVAACTYVPAGNGVRNIAILRSLAGERRLAVITHELGHLMGMSGHADTGVMVPYALPRAPIDEAAAEGVCAAGVVPCRWFEPETGWRP